MQRASVEYSNRYYNSIKIIGKKETFIADVQSLIN